MPAPSVPEPILESFRRGRLQVTLEEATWLAWPSETNAWTRAAMSQAQFVHLGAPVVAVQRNRRMEYFDENGELRWASNLPWPRANLEMARLPGQPGVLKEDASEEDSPEESSPEEDSPTEVTED